MKVRLVALAVMTALAGCSSEDGAESAQADVVVGTRDFSNDVTVLPDRLEFDAAVAPKLQSVLGRVGGAEPVYLVGSRQKDAVGSDGVLKPQLRNPTGYLRRALSWEKGDGGKIVVRTEPTTLADALEEVKKSGFIAAKSLRTLDDNGVDIDRGIGNTNQTWTHTFGPADGIAVVDLSGKQLWHKQLFNGGNADLVLSKGRIGITPSVQSHLLVERFVPKEASAILTADVQGDLEFLLSADGGYELFGGDTIYQKSYGTTVGKMPLTLDLAVKWDCSLGATGQSVARVGMSASGQVSAEAKWTGRVESKINPPTFSFQGPQPTVDSNVDVAGACHLITELKLQVFDAAGPEVKVDLAANLDARGSQAQLGGKGSARVVASAVTSFSGTLKPFGFKIAEIDVPPLRVEKELFSGEITVGKQ
jgi:hypothetical protein